MNKMQFFEELVQCASQYDQDNQWFGFLDGGKMDWSKGTWIQFILAAWKLYQNVNANQLQMILLGDTKIRSDPALLFNFGLAANTSSPQEDKDKKMVSELMSRRGNIASGTDSKKPVEIMGPGSILSAKRWSPMLNDAFVLGAIHTFQDFHFALNDDEQTVWRELTANQSKDLDAKETWLKFIHKVPRVLWENGKPRVFARELLGLKIFGYKPVFTLHELGFIHSGGGQQPTFQNYLSALNQAGFQNRDRTTIMKQLSEFLFNDATALSTVGASAS